MISRITVTTLPLCRGACARPRYPRAHGLMGTKVVGVRTLTPLNPKVPSLRGKNGRYLTKKTQSVYLGYKIGCPWICDQEGRGLELHPLTPMLGRGLVGGTPFLWSHQTLLAPQLIRQCRRYLNALAENSEQGWIETWWRRVPSSSRHDLR